MAKTLDKLSKEAKKLDKGVHDLRSVLQSLDMQNETLRKHMHETAVIAGLAAVDLKAKGHTGQKMSDFKSDKSVASAMKILSERTKLANKENAKLLASRKTLIQTHEDLTRIAKELGEEITKRKKKSSRKLFKIQSDSLPGLEALKKSVDESVKTAITLFNDYTALIKNKPFEYETYLNKVFSDTLSDPTKDKNKFDISHTFVQNKRTQNVYLKKTAKLLIETKKLCDTAVKKAKAQESHSAEMDAAANCYREILKMKKLLAKVKESATKEVNQGKKNGIKEQEKRGLLAIASMDKILAVEQGIKKTLAKATQQTFIEKQKASVT